MNESIHRIKKEFNALAKSLKLSGAPELSLIGPLRERVFNEIERQQRAVVIQQHKNKEIVPPEDRFVTKEFKGSQIKFTYRPTNGEIAIKIPLGTSQLRIDLARKLAEKIKNEMSGDVCVSMRGIAHFNGDEKSLRVTLGPNHKNGVKVFNQHFIVDDLA